jgi:3-oxoacyl-[acyl-carrier-protein] synthase III
MGKCFASFVEVERMSMLEVGPFTVPKTARSPKPYIEPSKAIGISAIATYRPPWVLGNDWFEDTLSRKFVQHTGILFRHISLEDEVTMGIRAVENLRERTACDLRNCGAVVFAGSSLIHRHFARRYLSEERARREDYRAVAQEFAERLHISSAPVFGINWGCSGYSKAMQVALRCATRCLKLGREQFILVVTVNRTSKITDYGCKATAPIFGDFAEATLVGGADSHRYPIKFALIYAIAERSPADSVFFNYHLRENVVVPKTDGGRGVDPQRIVFSMDMMGLGDGAPRAMADATDKALKTTNIRPEEVDFVVPHQAGTSLVNLTTMRLEELGIKGNVINGLTREVGNISSSSVPYVL